MQFTVSNLCQPRFIDLDLHSVWDSRLIAKSLRTIPKNYTLPLPSRRIESALRGTIYDPYVRQIMHEGVLGRFESEIDEWLSCPSVDEGSLRPYPPTERFQQLPLSDDRRQKALLGSPRRTPPPGLPPTDDGVLCPYAWSAPLHSLNCEIIWPLELDELQPNSSSTNIESTLSSETGHEIGPNAYSYLELDTPEYAGAIKERWLVEKLLAMGGIRLAAILNYLFAVEGESTGPLRLVE